jgi:hypothetical protein
MKTLHIHPLHLAAALGLSLTVAACGGDAGECVGAPGAQTCVYEVCDDDDASCHFEVHSQAMTKNDLVMLVFLSQIEEAAEPPK